jgi:predicted transcriptional regulator
MNYSAPVSTIMSRDLQVVLTTDYANLIEHFFEIRKSTHILVMKHGNVVGIISEPDFRNFLTCLNRRFNNRSLAKTMLNVYTAEDIMNKEFSIIDPFESISVALELLGDNIYNALPVVDKGRFIGVITAHHIIKTLTKGRVVTMIPQRLA